MSGGTAYVYDVDGRFYSRVNPEMVVALPIKRQADIDQLRELIESHVAATGSPHGRSILADWESSVRKFVRVIAKERAALEAAEEKHEAASQPAGNR